MTAGQAPVDRPDTFRIGGDLEVHRLGYGAMHLTGPGMWGPPEDPRAAVRVLRRAVELGVDFVDTADSYGPGDNERLIKEALHPYPEGLVITTKGGMLRSGPDDWTSPPEYVVPLGRPAYLRQQVELSLRNLGLERIDLYQLHSIDPLVPLADQLGVLTDLRAEGKIRHIGVSGQPEVGVDVLEEALRLVPDLAAVENLYNVADRAGEPALRYAEGRGLAFLPWFPLGHGGLLAPGGPLEGIAADFDVTPGQLALAWLLHTSPATIAIPGTTSVEHLEANVRATELRLTEGDLEAIVAAVDASGTVTSRPAPDRPDTAPALEGTTRQEQVLRELYRDLSRIERHCATDVVLHPGGGRDLPERIVGIDAFVAWQRELLDRSGGTFRVDVERVVAAGAFATVTGTMRATLHDRPLEQPFCGVWRFDGDRIVEHWEHPWREDFLDRP